MYKIDERGNIHLTRGDTAYIQINLSNYTYTKNDYLVFSVKKTLHDEEYMINKIFDPTKIIVLNPEDTRNYETGRFYFDVELHTTNGEVFTVIGPNYFYLKEEVTRG